MLRAYGRCSLWLRWLIVCVVATVAITPSVVLGFVAGQAPTPLSSHTLFGNAKAIGQTLMLPGPRGTEIRSILLTSSSSTLSGLPADAQIVRAYVFWSASLAQNGVTGPKVADPTVTFTAANGTSATVNAGAGGCRTVVHPTLGTAFPPFYYCRADVTSLVAANPSAGQYNGVYTLGGVNASAGQINAQGNCTETPFPRCQAKYAAWSMVVIYRSPSETLQRDIRLYDGFLVLDHQDGPNGSTAQTSFTIGGFLADANPQATLTYFAVETDSQLGIPPQNLLPPPLTCTTCDDYVRFNGTTLVDGNNWPGNIFNESLANGTGVDIDSIDVSNLLPGGSTSATITIGSGTAPVQNPAPQHGGGELFGYGWTLLTLRRPAPNFRTSATNKTVNPTQGGQGETVAYTVNVTNAGSLPGNNVVVTDTIPGQMVYTPDSAQVGGTPCTDAADGDPCTFAGGVLRVNLGTVSHLPGQNTRQISFLARIAPGAPSGATICNNAQIVSQQTPTAHSTNNACVRVVAPQLDTPTKVDTDLDGGVPEPEDIIQFQVVIRKQSTGQVSGLSFTDDMPADVQLLSVLPPTGATNNSTTTGGANGKGRIDISNITIPAGTQSVTITYLAQVDSVAEFAARGVPANSINGRVVCNQGTVAAAFLPTGSVLTDDPSQAGSADRTCFTLVFAPNLSTSNKVGTDLNGGRLEPGDRVRYTINLRNTGNRDATVSLTDDLPPAVTGFTLVTPTPGLSFAPAPAGANNTGRITVSNLVVPAGGTRAITFEVTIASTVNDNQAIQNCSPLSVAEAAAQNRTVCSTTLNVFARPDLEQAQKTVIDANGGNVQPGDTLTYTISVQNDGNRPATNVVITDVVSATLTNVVPAGGGTFDAGTRTITWTLGSVPAGATVTRTFTAAVVVPTANGTQLCNQGRVASTELPDELTDNPATPQNDDATCVTVISAPDFSTTTKTVADANGAPVRPGDLLTYTVTVRNSGTETGTNITVVDVVPTNLENVAPQDGGTFDPGTRRLSWPVGSLAPGASRVVRFSARVVTPLLNGTTIDNQAFVISTQTPTPGVPSDDPATVAVDDPTRVTVVSAPDLGGSDKTVFDQNGGAPQPGDTLLYAITVRNTGDSPARQTVVSDVIAANLENVTPRDGGTFNAATRTITWPATTVVPGTPRVVRFTAQVRFPLPSGTVVCNQGRITSTDLGAATVLTDDLRTAAVDDPTCVTVVSQPDLGGTEKRVSDLNGGSVEPGDRLEYSIVLRNVGTADATNVVVTDVVPANLVNIAPLDGGTLNAGTRTITWNVARVPARGQVTVRFTVEVRAPLDGGTRISNQATVLTPGFPTVQSDDPRTPADDDPTVVTVVATPVFSTSTKTVTDQNGGIVEPGDLLTYTLTIRNSGKSNADQVVVSDVLDANLTFVSAGQGGAFNAATRTITWSGATTAALQQLAPGAANAVTLTFVARVNTPLANGTQICNQGRIASQEVTAPQPTDNPATPAIGDQTCLSVTSAPDLSNTTKTVVDNNGGDTRPGDLLTYTITVTNTGNAAARNVTVTDVVDQNLGGVVVAQGGTFNGVNRTITWSAATTPALASIAAGASVSLSFQASAARPLDNGTVIRNQATISSADLAQNVLSDDPRTPAVDDPTAVTITAAPNVTTSTKTVTDQNGGDVVPGDVLLYTITLRNTGDALARSVVVTDAVPQQLTLVQPLDGGTFDAANRTITWNVPQVGITPGGDVRVRFRAIVRTPLPNNTRIENQAQIRVGNAAPVPTDDPSTPAVDDPTVVIVTSEPNLDNLAKTVAGTLPGRRATPGSTLTYTITVTNTGTDTARSLVFTDVVDQVFENVQPQDGGTFNAQNRTITWNVAQLAPGQTATLRFSARVRTDVANGATVDNQAFVQRQGSTQRVPSNDPTTPQDDDPTRVTIEARVDLENFTKAVRDNNGGDVEPGDTLTYTLVVRNAGTAAALAVEVTDPLPPQLDNVQPGQGGQIVTAQNLIRWNQTTTPALARIEPGQSVTLTFTARVVTPTPDGTQIRNQASVRATSVTPEPSDDPSTPNNDDPTVVRVVSRPELATSQKRVIDLNGGRVQPGDVLEYEIRVINSGKADALQVRLIDPVPTHTTYVNGSTRLNGAAVADSGGNQSPLARGGLPVNSPGQQPGRVTTGAANAAVVRFRVRVRPDTQEGTIISNQGILRSQQLPLVGTDDPRTPQRGDATQTVVGFGPILDGVTKTYAPTPLGDNGNGVFDPGEVISYRVTIPNTGSAPATGVVFTDPLDPNGRGRYVPGTLGLDGRGLSDAADGDAGRVNASGIRVALGTIAPGKTAVITYQVRVVSGPSVINQATVRSTQLQPELSDADGNEANGDQPTVVPVGANNRRVRATKKVLDVNGGYVEPGDELLYTITLSNEGGRDEGVDVSDDIPANTTYIPNSAVGTPGTPAQVLSPPQGAFQRGRVSFSAVQVPRGGRVTLLFRVRVATNAQAGQSVCNVARYRTGAGGDQFRGTDPACALVGAPLGSGGLRGTVFRDIGVDNKVLGSGDTKLAGFQVQAFYQGNPSAQPISTAVSSSDGSYRLQKLAPGPYSLRILTSTGAQIATMSAVKVYDGKLNPLDLPVDPTGIIYHAKTGKPLRGVRVKVVYDQSDPTAAGKDVPESLLGHGQQGQLTDNNGFYKLDLQVGRRYRIVVEPRASSLSFPSALLPATPGFAKVGAEQEVVPDDVPEPTKEGAKLKYYLKIKADDEKSQVYNNHIAVDPLSSLIRLEKRADKARATVGDIVTYTITVENRSSRDFTAQSPAGIEDILPRGLRYIRHRTRLVRRLRSGATCTTGEVISLDKDGATLCLRRDDATTRGGRLLRFGPFPLGSGESLRLVYQVAVGLDTKVGSYKNVAVLKDGGFAAQLSNRDEARVLVEADPDFDQGLLLGKVFCDKNKNGKQDRGEHGVAGARIYLDNGMLAITDTKGKYHLRDIDPGLRLLKIDVNTLRPGSRLTTSESRVVQFTRGLPAKVSFGVACVENWVKAQQIVRKSDKKKGKPKRVKNAVVPTLSIAGDAKALRVSANQRVVKTLEADALVRAPKMPAPTKDWDKRPATALSSRVVRRGKRRGKRVPPSVIFELRARGRPVRGWRLSLWRLESSGGRQLLRRFSGGGAPPAQLAWDGTLGGKPALTAGHYEIQLEALSTAGSGARSPRRRFTVDVVGQPWRLGREAPRAQLDGGTLPLDGKHRFALTLGRVGKLPLLLTLARGDGKSTWVSLGTPPAPPDREPPERIKVEGNLKTGKLTVDGKTVDASLLRIGLSLGNVPSFDKRGKLRGGGVRLVTKLTSTLLSSYKVVVRDAFGRAVRQLGGTLPVPKAIVWDGRDKAGQTLLQPGTRFTATLTVNGAHGDIGQSAPLRIVAPRASFGPAVARARRLFALRDGKPSWRARRVLRRLARALRKRPSSERYRVKVVVAPPVTWQSVKWAGLIKRVQARLIAALKKAGLTPARYELSVGALPIGAPAPRTIKRTPPAGKKARGALPKRRRRRRVGRLPRKRRRRIARVRRLELLSVSVIPPPAPKPKSQTRVLVDGNPLNVDAAGRFGEWVKVDLGSALIIDLRDSAGRRAVLMVPTKAKTRVPTSRREAPRREAPRRDTSRTARRVAGHFGQAPLGVTRVEPGSMVLRMRGGAKLELKLAQAGSTSGKKTAPTSKPATPGKAGGAPAATAKPAPAATAKPAPAATAKPAPAAKTAPPARTAPAARTAAGKATGPWGSSVLRKAFKLSAPAKPKVTPKSDLNAARLSVDLPKRGAVLKSRMLTLRGKTHPKNKLTVNGAAVQLRPDGTFTHALKLPEGKSTLSIEARDPGGNVGRIRWPVQVSDRALFLMVLAEGAIGQAGVQLPGDTAHSRLDTDKLLLRGRTAIYFKARIKGKYLFKRYLITAHVDTAKQRQFEEFFDQVIDPNRYYPIYGDSATHVRDVNSRGKFYVLVKADRSKLLVGNFTAAIKGIDLLRYDRMLHGVKVDLDKTLAKKQVRVRVRGFVSNDDTRLARDHNVLRATGGSIYYLRHGQVVEGSERIRLVVRERDTGLKLAELVQSRDNDYRIDYAGGRILFRAPVSSVADSTFSVNNPTFSLSTLAGHPVYIEVDYEYDSSTERGAGSWGVQAKTTLFDVLTIGATYVSETRKETLGADYQLYGGEITLRRGQATQLTAEFARSHSFNNQNFISQDGGVSYLALNNVAMSSGDPRARDANAFKVRGQAELSDFAKSVKRGTLRASAYFAKLDRGFYSGGTILDQGRTRYGGRVDWAVTKRDKITVRHDGAIALLPQYNALQGGIDPLAMRELQTELTRVRYRMKRGRFTLAGEYAHAYMRDPMLDDLQANRDTIGVRASYRIFKWLKVFAGQDVILALSGNDPQLGAGAPLGLSVVASGSSGDRAMTTVGAEIALGKRFALQLAESVRWSGDNATMIGLKTQVSKNASTYLRQVLSTIDGGTVSTTIVGAEDRFGPKLGGRTYGEYQVETGVNGRRNRAILGLKHKWRLSRGVAFLGGFEHQQVFAGRLPDGTPTGDSQRDVVHIGFEFVRPRTLKLSTRAELRYDLGTAMPGLGRPTPSNPNGSYAANVNPALGATRGLGSTRSYADRQTTPGSFLLPTPGERWQVVTRTAASWAATRDLTFMGRLNYYRTWNKQTGQVEAEALEIGFGAALRPVTIDWLDVLFKYTRVLEMRPMSLTDNLKRRRTYDILSLVPIIELPLNLQLVEKVAYKRVYEELDVLANESLGTVTHTLLWINRLNLHITGRLDAGVEYRLLRMWLEAQGDQLKHGWLVEAGYWVHRMIRLGIGYNFTRFTDNEFVDQDRDAGGFFFRVVGRY